MRVQKKIIITIIIISKYTSNLANVILRSCVMEFPLKREMIRLIVGAGIDVFT